MADDKSLTSSVGLSRLAGSFWTETYDQRTQPESIFSAVAELSKQFNVETDAAVAAVSRSTVEPYRRERWSPLLLKRSDLNTTRGALLHFGEGAIYGPQSDGVRYQYGVSQQVYFTYPAPANLVRCGLLGTRISTPGRCWILGLDVLYDRAKGLFLFREDPLATAEVATQIINDDLQATIWMCDALFDAHDVWQQYGFVYGFSARQDSAVQKPGMQAVADATVGGTSQDTFEQLISAGTGIPRTLRDEQVIDIAEDATGRFLATDRAIYRIPEESTVPWVAGETIPAGSFVTEDVLLQQFSQPQVPSWLRGLAIQSGMIANGFLGDFVLYNDDVELHTTQQAGRTRVSFDIGGTPEGAKAFFDEVHRRGADAALTFWDALEQEYGAHPSTINPLEFFVKHWFRGTLLVLRLSGAALHGPGWTHLRFLKKLTPPNVLLVVIVDLRPPHQEFTIAPNRLDRFRGPEPQVAGLTIGGARSSIRRVATNCE